MNKNKLISPGCLTLLIIFVVIIAYAQWSVYEYVKRKKEADKKQINLVISGKLPESLRCVKEIKIKNGDLLISLDETISYDYKKKISENPILIRNSCKPPVLIYDSCTDASHESSYKESLSLEYFDGRSAKFLTTVSYNVDKKPEIHKKDFIVSE